MEKKIDGHYMYSEHEEPTFKKNYDNMYSPKIWLLLLFQSRFHAMSKFNADTIVNYSRNLLW